MHLIELSTVAFYEGRAPRVIPLGSCSWPLTVPVTTGLCGVYGTKSKPEAFMAARAYADRNRLNFTVIDFVVALEHKPHPSVMKPPELSSYDFFSLLRMSGPMGSQVKAWLEAREGAVSQHADLLASLRPEHVLMQAPSLIDELASTAECAHVRLFAFPATTAIGDLPLNLGFVPFGHWHAIQSATCRLDPTVHVTLDPPEGTVAKAAPKSPAARPKASPRTRESKT